MCVCGHVCVFVCREFNVCGAIYNIAVCEDLLFKNKRIKKIQQNFTYLCVHLHSYINYIGLGIYKGGEGSSQIINLLNDLYCKMGFIDPHLSITIVYRYNPMY